MSSQALRAEKAHTAGGMTEEQITNRYVRGWISEAEFKAEMVEFYKREDLKDKIDRIVREAYEKRNPDADGDPIENLVRLAVRLALIDAAAVRSALAVNCHDELVDEAGKVVAFLESTGMTTKFLDGLRAAIAKATGAAS